MRQCRKQLLQMQLVDVPPRYDIFATGCYVHLRACGVCTDVRQSWEESQSKSSSKIEKIDKTPVTVADFAVQAVVALHLQVCRLNDNVSLYDAPSCIPQTDGHGGSKALNMLLLSCLKGGGMPRPSGRRRGRQGAADRSGKLWAYCHVDAKGHSF